MRKIPQHRSSQDLVDNDDIKIIHIYPNQTNVENCFKNDIYIFISYLDIEDLTHKTGNFKQYDIFLSMLESALKQVCSASCVL